MKKLLLIILLFSPLIANAQLKRIRSFEIELGVNYPFAAGKYSTKEVSRGKGSAENINYNFRFYGELRYNIKPVPVDVGLRVDLSRFIKDYAYVPPKHEVDWGYFNSLEFKSFSFEIVSNYSFRRGKNINPYAGFGIGFFAPTPLIGGVTDQVNPPTGGQFLFEPQIGVKFLNLFNLSLGYKITNGYKDWQYATVRLGAYF